ncbi:MAG: hypothetical protein HYY40_09565 [Bacteroidetes bacterium]|nr:hypothetical protein [Bacteroidota bacterium]
MRTFLLLQRYRDIPYSLYIIPFIFFIFCPYLFSQGIYNNGAYIVIQTGAYVYIDGDGSGDYRNETSTSNGSIDLDGELILEGDWTNNATGGNVFINIEGAPDGWTRFKGTTNQTIGGTRDTYFEKFEVNNTAAGTSVTLNRDVNVFGSCAMTDGVISTGANYFILRSTTAADLSGFSSGSFVYGNLRRYIASNTSTYDFPVGSNNASTNYYRSDFINGNLTGVSYLTASVGILAEGGNNVDARVISNPNAFEGGQQYQNVVGPAAGQATEWTFIPDAPVGTGNYNLNLYVANISELSAADDDKFNILKRPDGSSDYNDWDALDATTSIPANGGAGRIYSAGAGYAQKNGFTSFSKFVIAKADNPLPVELLYFSGVCEGGVVKLSWATASETNSDYFTVEKSEDGITFRPIGEIPAQGNSHSVVLYNYSDAVLPENVSYYILKQTDIDGKTEQFATIAVDACAETTTGDEINAWSAGDGFIVIRIIKNSGGEENYPVTLFDMVAREVLSAAIHVDEGANHAVLNTGNLAPALYILNVNNSYKRKLALY